MAHFTLSRFAKRCNAALRNAPLAILGTCVVFALETYSAGGIFQTVTETVTVLGLPISLAIVQASISFGCGLLAFWGSMATEAFKSDPRPNQQRRAFGARVLSLALLGVPIFFLGQAIAFQKQVAEYHQYAGSAAFQADQALAHDVQADSQVKLEAAQNLAKASKPLVAEFDFFAFLGAAFLHGAPMLAAGIFWRAKRETEAEARRREAATKRAVSSAKAAKTRAENAKKKPIKLATNNGEWVKGLAR